MLLPKHRRSTETLWHLDAINLSKYYRNPCQNPVREHISMWTEFDSRSEQLFGAWELLPEAVTGSIPGRDTFSS